MCGQVQVESRFGKVLLAWRGHSVQIGLSCVSGQKMFCL